MDRAGLMGKADLMVDKVSMEAKDYMAIKAILEGEATTRAI
jgi:hypothetical protein